MAQAYGLYIHIPFCKSKCGYCDFLSFEENSFDAYVCALLREIKSAQFADKIDTVYIGGGTPTALPSLLLCEILSAVQGLPLLPNAEITVEANPGTVDFNYLAALKAGGVNRLSFGLQTTHEHLLRAVGRMTIAKSMRNRPDRAAPENAELAFLGDFAATGGTDFELFRCKIFYENFRAARDVGFDNINVDLMFALPSQTLDEWRETLAEIVALSPEHISAYSLTPAENTPLFAQIERGEITLPSDETDREMYHHARRFLAKNGYTHYEISNFAKPNRESRHNINCWTMKPYIGFGLGAHSFDGKTRWNNTENLRTFLKKSSAKNFKIENFKGCSGEAFEKISSEVLKSEKIILGLRLMRGVRESEFSQIYENEIAKLIKDGLLERQQDRLRLTPRGMDFANRVFEEFILL
jgi:oxygen-independent coproporphyrinogen-3 oxidase